MGYDLILYKRPVLQSNASMYNEDLLILLTETVYVANFSWVQILGYRRIVRATEGWLVFHLNARLNGYLTPPGFCIRVHIVLARQNINSTLYTLLGRGLIEDVFILEESRPNELPLQPVIAVYIQKPIPPSGVSPFIPSPDPFPFIKRSLSEIASKGGMQDINAECSL